MAKPNKSKLEYSDEPDVKEEIEPALESPPVIATPIVPPPSMKKARSDAQKATTARMRVKLEERRRDLVVIKQEAKETALLQQIELKAHIKDKLKAKQLKTKADAKMRQMMVSSESEDEEEDEESEPEERIPIIRKKQQTYTRAEPKPKPTKQLPSGRPTYASQQEFPSVRFV